MTEYEELVKLCTRVDPREQTVSVPWFDEHIAFQGVVLCRMKKRLTQFFLKWRDEFFPNEKGVGGTSVWNGFRLKDGTRWTKSDGMLKVVVAAADQLKLGMLGLHADAGAEIQESLRERTLPYFLLHSRKELEEMSKNLPSCFGLLYDQRVVECQSCEDKEGCGKKYMSSHQKEKVNIVPEVNTGSKPEPLPGKEKVTSFDNPGNEGDSQMVGENPQGNSKPQTPREDTPDDTAKEEVSQTPETDESQPDLPSPKESTPEPVETSPDPAAELTGKPTTSELEEKPVPQEEGHGLGRSAQRQYGIELLKQGPHSRKELQAKIAVKFNTKGRAVNMLILELKKKGLIRKEGKKYVWLGG